MFFLFIVAILDMILYELFSIILGFQLVLLLITADESVNTISVLMPDAVANHVCIIFHDNLVSHDKKSRSMIIYARHLKWIKTKQHI